MNTFSEVLKKYYHEQPQKATLYLLQSGHDDIPVDYRDLINGAAAYAQAIQVQGIQQGEVVILILQHGRDLINAFFGAILHGAIPAIMPFLTEKLLPERYRSDLASLVSITKPSAVITYPEFLTEVQAALKPDDSVRAVIVSDQVPSSATPDFDTLGGLKCSPEEIVFLQHSSGTTGLQKGVALSHQAVFNQIENYARSLKYE